MYAVNINSGWQLYDIQFSANLCFCLTGENEGLAMKFIAYHNSSGATNALHQSKSRLLNMSPTQFPSLNDEVSRLLVFSYPVNVVQRPDLMMQLRVTAQHKGSQSWGGCCKGVFQDYANMSLTDLNVKCHSDTVE